MKNKIKVIDAGFGALPSSISDKMKTIEATGVFKVSHGLGQERRVTITVRKAKKAIKTSGTCIASESKFILSLISA